jgi:hypothetical protein
MERLGEGRQERGRTVRLDEDTQWIVDLLIAISGSDLGLDVKR